jgi:hypothetical protein
MLEIVAFHGRQNGVGLFTLSQRNQEHTLSRMLHTFKAWMATLASLWIAVLACFMGCMLPILAQHQSGAMANMECCHSGDKSPAKPNDGKSAPSHHRMSCCLLEVTVASKLNAATMDIAPTRHSVPTLKLDLATTWFYHPVELAPPVWHSGRDTLLETSLLRI